MRLYYFGYGYTAAQLRSRLLANHTHVSGTCRSPQKRDMLRARGIDAHIFSDDCTELTIDPDVTHILHSIPPGEQGDIALPFLRDAKKRFPKLQWFGYLSTTGVYGDHQGAVVTETSPLYPTNRRSERRIEAERAWLRLHCEQGLPVHIFRLAGIYGPGRNALDDIISGKARRIIKEDQVFSRIHVDDIASMLIASIHTPSPGSIYNGADDMPEASDVVVSYAASLLNAPLPPAFAYDDPSLSPMTRSFYSACRRVDNSKTKELPGMRFAYPTYKEGLQALLRDYTK